MGPLRGCLCGIGFPILLLCLLNSNIQSTTAQDWVTKRHEAGYCAMRGICGYRKDKDPLNCATNIEAPKPTPVEAEKLARICPSLYKLNGGAQGGYCCTEEQLDTLDKSTTPAKALTVGCPACYHNFMHFWCILTCAPDQSAWTNVTAVQKAYSNNATAVAEVAYWVDPHFGNAFFDSCKDMKMGASNMPVMRFLGGGATNYQQFLDFLGELKDKRPGLPGSPFQQDFLNGTDTPEGMAPLNYSLPTCADPQYRCSCGDCPANPVCKVPDDSGSTTDTSCHVGSMTCFDVGLILLYAVLVGTAGAWYVTHHSSANLMKTEEEDIILQPRTDSLLHQFSDLARTMDDDSAPLPDLGLLNTPRDRSVTYPWAEQQLQPLFYKLGKLCALRPQVVILCAAAVVMFCCMGLIRFSVQTDPLALWVGPGSDAALDKKRYDAAFGPFYRVEQLIISSTPNTVSPYSSASPGNLPAIVTDSNIQTLFDMQEAVDNLTVTLGSGASAKTIGLTDICFKPFGDACAIQSILQFWKMSRTQYKKDQVIHHTADYCFLHWSTDCRATYEAPVDPNIVTGGFPKGSAFRNFSADATALVVTYPVNSAPENEEAAVAWEREFIKLAKGKLSDIAAAANLTLSFSSQSSVQDELARESYTDAGTVLASYFVMLAYIALALWKLPSSFNLQELLISSRAGLGLVGVLIVAASVAGALGLVSMAGIWSTLIIMEVIPFLVLAVGVDNMFVLAHALQRQGANQPVSERIALALMEAGPSIALAASCEVVAFGLGALTPMPAVRNFSLCASLAVLLDFFLQVTAFTAYLALDTERLEGGLPDCAIWAPAAAVTREDIDRGLEAELLDGGDSQSSSPSGTPPRLSAYASKATEPSSLHKLLTRYVERIHIPYFINRKAIPIIIAVFLGSFLLSLAGMERLEVGLDQAVALPRDSYLQTYFKDLMTSLRVGPPLYFVVNKLNVTSQASINTVCSVSGCDDNSLVTQITAAASRPSATYIATPAASWIDDYLSWINPEVPQCCRQKPAPGGTEFCDSTSREKTCVACYDFDHLINGTRPSLAQMQDTLPGFLQAKPSQACAKGGAGVYTTALEMNTDHQVAGLDTGVIKASAFRTYYPPLNTQKDFIQGLRAVFDFVKKIREELKLDIYAYSVHHVFFEQYLYVLRDARLLLGLPLLAIFIITCLLTSSVWAGGILLLVLSSLLVHLTGSMYLSGIQLNAVSLVNLAMALGIAVEFCAHVLHAFVVAPGTRLDRAAESLNKVGASVLSGITLTKFVGVAVLAFAQTQIFSIYYFRLYLALVILGAAHGLVLLPALLALMGPPSL